MGQQTFCWMEEKKGSVEVDPNPMPRKNVYEYKPIVGSLGKFEKLDSLCELKWRYTIK